jgi:regulator of protease activity HflC (stomatin/prohibitin superfamily)
MIEIILISIGIFIILILVSGIRIIRPTHKGIVETLGKFSGIRDSGFNFIIPLFQRMMYINITEKMSDVEPQIVITKDNLNCKVDLVVFYRIKKDPKEIMKSVYEVNNVDAQLETLARTTARNVIGTLIFKDVNSERNELNKRLQQILSRETTNWGVEVLKVELKDVVPPEDVQETMNRVIKANNEKEAASDFSSAREIEADGVKRAAIKESEGRRQSQILEAEGLRQSKILVAQGEAERIKLVYQAADKYFIKNAKDLKKLEVTQASLENNSKVILTEKGINAQLLIGELPISKTK